MREDVGDVDTVVCSRGCIVRHQLREGNEARISDRKFRDGMLVGVSDHAADAGETGNFLRSTLCIASRHHNLATGIFATDPANGRAGVLIGGCRDSAGVEHDDIGIPRPIGACQSPLVELLLDGGAIRLGSAAAEILYEESRHRFMLANCGTANRLPRAFAVVKTIGFPGLRKCHLVNV